jgi:cell division septum initiation protein DivIVA
MDGMTLRDTSPEKPREQLKVENDRLRAILDERVADVKELTQKCEQYKHDAARWAFAKQKYHARLGHATARDFQSSLDKTMIAHKETLDKIKKLDS